MKKIIYQKIPVTGRDLVQTEFNNFMINFDPD